ncbi:MAG: arginine deiminase [Bacilli bacterium]|nr:arginine deiminase [Bacilli bacterium]
MINVYSEIGKLKTVLLHYPGEELNNLIPRYLEELLFDDIPWLPLARAEHDAFANAFRNAGVKVVYLEDLVADVLKDSEIKEKFVKEFVSEASIHSETLKEIVTDYLMGITDPKELVLKTMAGIKKSEMESDKKITLTDYVVDYPFVCNPMPNLYFTRDPFASIYDGICLNKMYSATRSRETIYAKYIFLYHKDYKGTKLFYNRDNELNIEGGDILVLNKETLIVGVSERTHSGAIEKLAKNMFYEQKTSLKRVLAFTIPKMRTFMHLDTVFTQVDYDKFTIHKECYETLKVYEVTKDEEKVGKLKVKELNDTLEDILEAYIGKKVTLIPCGGEDSVSAAREQWSDGSNTIAIAPGEVIAYERNDITNKTLKNYGITVHTIPSSELSRGRGGPRCMCMPLERE